MLTPWGNGCRFILHITAGVMFANDPEWLHPLVHSRVLRVAMHSSPQMLSRLVGEWESNHFLIMTIISVNETYHGGSDGQSKPGVVTRSNINIYPDKALICNIYLLFIAVFFLVEGALCYERDMEFSEPNALNTLYSSLSEQIPAVASSS